MWSVERRYGNSIFNISSMINFVYKMLLMFSGSVYLLWFIVGVNNQTRNPNLDFANK